MHPCIENCRIDLQHVAPFDEALWAELVTRFDELELGPGPEFDSESLTGLGFGPVIGTHDSRIAFLSVTRYEDSLRLSFKVGPRPSAEPPAEFIRIADTLGGQDGLVALARSVFGRHLPVVPCSIELRAPRSQYKSLLLPAKLSQRELDLLGDLGETARREAVGFRFESGALGLTEVMLYYLHEEDEYLVSISANLAFKPGEKRWLPFADDVAEFVAQRLFEEVG